jgi:hypothetical protein
MGKKATGQYRWRVVVLARVPGQKLASGEVPESWPDPAPGTGEYQAARDGFTAGETIVQGIRQSEGAMKFRIKGAKIPVSAADRLKLKTTGELFNVTGVSRDEGEYETILTVERLHQQSVQQ